MGQVIDINEQLQAKRGTHADRLVVTDPVHQVPMYVFSEETLPLPPQTPTGSYSEDVEADLA